MEMMKYGLCVPKTTNQQNKEKNHCICVPFVES